MTPVNTKKVERREVRLSTLDDYRRELDTVERAHRAGTLRTLGNWSPGTILNHLAEWIDYPFDGFPDAMKPPLIIRLMVRPFKKKFLRGRMPAGFRIPKIEGGTFGIVETPFDEGLSRLRRSIDRLGKQAPPIPSPLFGAMSKEEWTSLQLRHAELHLGFLVM